MDQAVAELQPPSDSISVQDVAKHYNVGRKVAERMIDNLIKEGKLKFLGTFPPHGARYYSMVNNNGRKP